ncbi:probable G-protein coupled receptor No18 [Oppia nitens]|uniref:probable G-protein coupled receptor No18 n=1 Tax=Oppia nitens TaxID=1686743 RepID=UPI0023DCC658|nr:probable G-protein coupled receptor No18 [Oppia nitens]
MDHHLNDDDSDNGVKNLFYISELTYVIMTVILSLASLLAIPGNILVILVVMKTPVLRSKAVNILIVNLCVNDLLSTWIDIPLMWTILELNYGRSTSSYQSSSSSPLDWLCKWQIFINSLATCGQAVAFVTVGYERYHTICKPFDKEKANHITSISIACSWLISLFMSLIILLLVPDTITYEFCMLSTNYTKHEAMSFIIAPFGILCLVIIGFFYTRIVWLVRRHCKTTADTILRNAGPPLVVTSTAPAAAAVAIADQSSTTGQTPVSEQPMMMPSIYGEICVMNSKNRSLGRRRVEAQTAKRSLFVIITFTIIWLPYPLLVLIEKLLLITGKPMSHIYESIYEWQYCAHTMSCLSAGLNPLVYGLANKQFRTAFCRICRHYYKRYKDGVLFQ